jgi:hypothetical protein
MGRVQFKFGPNGVFPENAFNTRFIFSEIYCHGCSYPQSGACGKFFTFKLQTLKKAFDEFVTSCFISIIFEFSKNGIMP